MLSDAAAVKANIRARHRAARAGRPQSELLPLGQGIGRHGLSWAQSVARPGSTSFALYLGVGDEPPTTSLMEALHSQGYTVLLPICGPGRTLLWVRWTPEATFARSRFAPVMEPEGERLDLAGASGSPEGTGLAGIILPATAVDRSGNRIGQGGGYYDTFLAAIQRHGNIPPTIAVVYDDEVLPEGAIPGEPFDMRVQAALTPGGLVTFHGPDRPAQ
ncbi:5-formyltetrahydrofolate cyclo-ligase [Pseudarthrobacter sp. J64]|uniref:5-formyltetrahydrofolate cyclo-ligase n=1 Tax=Pseudarthrobacter sp. J64 TaxID=3116485 RepID=UPI002E8166CB|nr:5-formyltetrahydrofolate cyclo-ligase [Pseudarthrobacter sp. J64]MEE2568167.1 5-formyltetrahydrofolate cyclo-ligase [Pseudarthrobacter sp. J64]